MFIEDPIKGVRKEDNVVMTKTESLLIVLSTFMTEIITDLIS
ncbi:MAG: hypothetical protein AB1610_10885 [Nitrospirota bacterium]